MSSTDPTVNPRDLIAPTTITAIWASVFGILMAAIPVLIIWILGASGAGSLTSAIRTSFLAWPISHGVPVSITSVNVDVLPILAIIFPILVLRRAAIRILKIVPFSIWSLLAVVLPMSLVNSFLSFLLAWLVSDEVIGISPIATPLIVLVVSIMATLFGALRVYGWPRIALAESLRFGVRVGLMISSALIATAFVLVVMRLGLDLANANEVVASVADTNGEKILTWLLAIGYLPIAVTWGFAWLLGPGVATGVDTAASFAVIDQAALPAMPWLAALPETTPQNGWYLLLVPIAITSLFSFLMWWSLHLNSFRLMFTNTLAALSVVTLVSVLLSLIGGGSIGPGRLTLFGPQWLPMIGGVFVTIAPVFALLLVLDLLRRWIKGRKVRVKNA